MTTTISSSSLSSRVNGQLSEINSQTAKVQAKIDRLVDLRVEGEIGRAEFKARKEELVNKKVASLERRRKILNETSDTRFEPMREPLKLVWDWHTGVAGDDLKKLRDMVSKVGLNWRLNSRKLLHDWIFPCDFLASRGVYTNWSDFWNDYRTLFDDIIDGF